jgi:hypothetical protein
MMKSRRLTQSPCRQAAGVAAARRGREPVNPVRFSARSREVRD